MTSQRLHRCAWELSWLLLAVCCVSVSGAQRRTLSPGAPEGTQGYRISGRVVDARSGSAVSRCIVEIAEIKRGLESRTVLTDEDGRFSFENVPAAKYRLTASRHGFLTQAYEQHDDYSTAIAVGPGLTSEGLVFQLMPGAIVSGTVMDDAGEPVRRAQVKLFRDQEVEGIRSTQAQSGATTDDRGIFEIADIQPGTYFLSVSAHPWYAMQRLMRPRFPTQQQSTLDSGREDADLDVAYPTMFYPDVTDSDAATPIFLKGGERLQADFTLHAERAMCLRIPMSAAELNGGYGISISHSVFGQQEEMPIAAMSSDGSSAIDIDGLLPGHYDVSLTKNFEGRQTNAHFSADVADGSTQISNAESSTDISLTGTVSASEGRLPRNSAIVLSVKDSRRTYMTPINDGGEFSLRIPPGTYEVLAQINRHYLAAVSATEASMAGRVLTVRPGTTPRLQVLVGNSYGQIDGTVMHDGHPASAVMVLLVPDHPRENHILFRRDQSDSDGTFTLSGIVPGHYRVLAIERGWELAWANPRVLAPFLLKSKPVDLRSNDHLQEAIELQTR